MYCHILRVRAISTLESTDFMIGENAEFHLEDWLPTLERASSWNCWTDEELLLQFAGHLRGRALQEWNLLREEDKLSYKAATQALQNRLDPGCRALAAQDFRHNPMSVGVSQCLYRAPRVHLSDRIRERPYVDRDSRHILT